nr:hypothetical protein [Tanacetum cinerariifolium]
MKTIHVQFDELIEPMALVHLGTGPASNFLTPRQISSGLVPNSVPATPYVTPTNKELEILFQPMFDAYLETPRVERPVHPAQAVQAPVNSVGTPSSTTIDQDAPSPSILSSSLALQSLSLHQVITAEPTYMEDHHVAPVDNNPFVNVFAPEPHSEALSSGDISLTESTYVSQTLHHLNKWSKDHDPSCPNEAKARKIEFKLGIRSEDEKGKDLYIMTDVNVNAPAGQAPTMTSPVPGCYRCQLDEQWFDLTKDTLRDALQITPVNNNQAFTSPPSSDALINIVNELGYPKLVRNLSNVVTNDMFQPW